MGESKKRQTQALQTIAGLDGVDRDFTMAVYALYEGAPLQGASYRLTGFLWLYLHDRLGIETTPVIGYAHDPSAAEDVTYWSHAWLERGEAVTDIAMARPRLPKATPPGPVLIDGRTILPGLARYAFRRQRSPAGEAAIQELLNGTDHKMAAAVTRRIEVHDRMTEMFKDPDAVRTYLDDAEDKVTYDRLATALERSAQKLASRMDKIARR